MRIGKQSAAWVAVVGLLLASSACAKPKPDSSAPVANGGTSAPVNIEIVDNDGDPSLSPVSFGSEPYSAVQTVAGGYSLDMGDLPQVYFAQHPEWVDLYNQSWEIHKSRIQKIPAAVNPETPYYVDEAFKENIFVWDTLFMMLYDRYGMNQFPVLASMDNFYYCQTDSDGEDNGYIPREIHEKTGKDYWTGYQDPNATNPPLFSWAEWECYQIHGDKTRFDRVINGKTIYDRLKAHYQFIETNKKLANGLYGNTTGLGTGLDNTPNQGDNQTHNSLSAQQAQNAYYMARIALALGKTEDATYYEAEHQRIADAMNTQLWNEEQSLYANLLASGSKTNISTPTSLWALIARVPSQAQATAMVQNQALNSQKLFRPNGLSTLAYDHREYVSEGGYWRGGVWAPTSYQYLKGLDAYGFADEAFEEAIRHVNTLATVYAAGLEGGYVREATLWENYSAEYERQGFLEKDHEASKTAFCGWTACLSIGLLLEDVAGVSIAAPDNRVSWDVKLREHHAVQNLYFSHNGQVNRVSLAAAARLSADEPLRFTVKADYPCDLLVTASGVTKLYKVRAGTHTYLHQEEAAGTAYTQPVLGAVSFSQNDHAELLSADTLTAALDSVYFTNTANPAITDGLSWQAGRLTGKIYNVNTVGISPTVQAGSLTRTATGALTSLGYTDAVALGRSYYESGDEGFMLCAEANNRLQTLRLVVGVSGGATGKLSAMLSDASAANVSLSVSGDGTYILDIPYAAASDNRYLLVKWTVDNDACSAGSVSLLGALLLENGLELPQKPENLTLQKGDGQFTVTASAPAGKSYDSYKIYVTDDTGATAVHSVASLPATISAQNDRTYTVAVSGIRGEYESVQSDRARVTPRTAYTDTSRVIGSTVRVDSKALDLTNTGTIDWVQFSTDDDGFAQKANADVIYGYTRNHTAVPNGEKGRVVDAPITYAATDCQRGTTAPINQSGVQTRGQGNGFSFFIHSTGQAQTLYLYTGTWVADGTIEFLIDGQVQYSAAMSGDGMNVFETKLSFLLSEGQTAEVRVTLGNPHGNGSALLFAAALDTAVTAS